MATVTLRPLGPFSLSESARFLEGFAPAGRDPALAAGPLRLAFPVEGSWTTAAVGVEQHPDGTVHADVTGESSQELCAQLARMLSLDVDGTGFAAVLDGDPVLAAVAATRPGLRPVGFHSPYEAACWAVISQRVRIVQAAQVRNRIVAAHGERFELAGVPISAFPAPAVLRSVAAELPLPEVKQQRLRGLAEAALDGLLDGSRLRALTAEEAIAEVTALPGIGPFSAELVVVRGAGHPDRFPAAEARLHAEMVHRYDPSDAGPATLAAVAERWRPYRSWAAFQLRTAREARTGEIVRGRRAD